MKIYTKIIISFLTLLIISAGAFFINNRFNNNASLVSKTQNNAKSMGINPLTGLEIDKDKINQRPVAIMINNLHSGQPLLGVSQADIMYECPTEGGITRILGVFKDPSAVPAIGSVRSSRPYFINIAKGLDAIYFHLGGSIHAYKILKSGYIDSIDLISHEKFMWRDQNRLKNLGLEHSALTSGEKIIAGIKSKGYKTQLEPNYKYPQKFDDNSQVLQGTDANKLTVIFSGYKSTLFTYDSENQTYLISQFNKPQMDDNTKEQNSKQNIILMNVKGQNMDNTELLSLDIIGNGTGKYMSHGKIIDIKWTRDKDTSPFKYYTTDDKELIMIPGKTYVCVLAQWTHINVE